MPPDSSRLRHAAARAVYESGTIVGKVPSLALLVARRRRHGEPLRADTDLVIEGYPRSANTLAVATIAAAQPGPIRIAHHLHAPAHVIAAVRRGVPALVLVRNPEDAVVELVLLKPSLTVGQALRGWVRFYEPLLAYRSGFVVATTEEVLSDPSIPVRRLNDRFDTSLAEPAGTQETGELAVRGTREYMAGREGPGLPLIGRTSETEEDRDEDRERLHREYRSVAPQLRDLARRLHQTFTDLAR